MTYFLTYDVSWAGLGVSHPITKLKNPSLQGRTWGVAPYKDPTVTGESSRPLVFRLKKVEGQKLQPTGGLLNQLFRN